jgi:hypothetical protein
MFYLRYLLFVCMFLFDLRLLITPAGIFKLFLTLKNILGETQKYAIFKAMTIWYYLSYVINKR